MKSVSGAPDRGERRRKLILPHWRQLRQITKSMVLVLQSFANLDPNAW